jgi:acyl-CoA thioester hydrolase
MIERPAHAIEHHVQVAFHHCDPLGVVWHGRYFEWFDEARAALFASVGLDVPEIRAHGHRLYVVETRCRYMVPLRYADEARVTAWFTGAQPLIRVAFDVRNERTSRWSARAATVLAVTDAAGELLPRTPDTLLARLPRVSAGP